MSHPFHVVDVFSGVPCRGNPVAVLLGADEPARRMQAIAGWTGTPETVFVSRPSDTQADYALRIFSPVRELAFAGHPSIGACHLLLELGLVTATGCATSSTVTSRKPDISARRWRSPATMC